MTTPTDPTTPREDDITVERDPLRVALLVALVLVLLASVGQSIYLLTYVSAQRQQQEQLACQSGLNTEFRKAITARDDAQRTLLTDILSGQGHPETQQSLRQYLGSLSNADALPDDTCGLPR